MIPSKLCHPAAFLMAAGLMATATGAAALPPPERLQVPSQSSEAEKIANRVLKAGSDLFDAKNASALAATYTQDGTVHVISKTEDQQYKDDVKRGRSEIEQFYSDLFRDSGPIDSENTVESVRMIAPDLIVIHGRFRPNTGQNELPFVQMRIKKGEEWLLKELWLFLSPGG
jgi:hypothetical protein